MERRSKVYLKILMPTVFCMDVVYNTFPYIHKILNQFYFIHKCLESLCLFSSLYFSIVNVDIEEGKAFLLCIRCWNVSSIYRRDDIGSFKFKQILASWISLHLKQLKEFTWSQNYTIFIVCNYKYIRWYVTHPSFLSKLWFPLKRHLCLFCSSFEP